MLHFQFRTALHIATFFDNRQIVKLLLENGANYHKTNLYNILPINIFPTNLYMVKIYRAYDKKYMKKKIHEKY
jgi:ankyrin repeat protein